MSDLKGKKANGWFLGFLFLWAVALIVSFVFMDFLPYVLLAGFIILGVHFGMDAERQINKHYDKKREREGWNE